MFNINIATGKNSFLCSEEVKNPVADSLISVQSILTYCSEEVNMTKKLKKEDYNSICDLYDSGKNLKEVGLAFGVSNMTIYRLLKKLQHPIRTYSEARKGHVGWNKGKPWSEEHKKKLSESHKGIPSLKIGIKMSVESRRKMSISQRKRFAETPYPEEVKKKQSDALKGRPKTADHIRKLSGENCHLWRGGISFEPYCPKFNNQLKKRIRERDNHTCQLCGCIENGKKHTCHHIHYDKPNCNPDLITLCNKCNCKVNHNRDYWEEYFMNNLRQRGLL